jgi:hypothetical protein
LDLNFLKIFQFWEYHAGVRVFLEYFAAVQMRYPIFWDVTPLHCVTGSRPFEATLCHLEGSKGSFGYITFAGDNTALY